MATTVEFERTGLGDCSIFLPIPGSPGTEGVALNQSTCTLSFPSIEVASTWTNDEAVGEVAMATVGVIVPNALGADYGGFFLPVTIGMAAGVTGGSQYITSSAPGVDYCKGSTKSSTACTIAAVWISSGTDIQQVGYTAPPASVSCSDPYQGVDAGDWSTTCSGIFSSEGAVTVADGSTFTFNLGRIADGQGEFSVIP